MSCEAFIHMCGMCSKELQEPTLGACRICNLFETYGGFLKWGYFQIIHFNKMLQYVTILGIPHLWKPHMNMPQDINVPSHHFSGAMQVMVHFWLQFHPHPGPLCGCQFRLTVSLKDRGNGPSFLYKIQKVGEFPTDCH